MGLSKKVKGIVFNIQRFSLHDGPGLRTVVFLKGCNLRCKWCSNPESQEFMPELYVSTLQCIGCNKCIDVCPNNALSKSKIDVQVLIDRTLCSGCGSCTEQCPSGAIQFYGKIQTADEIFKIVLRDSAFYRNSDGGITLSGGEPTLQSDFACEILSLCKEEGINTAIETCGFTSWANLEKLLPLLDYIYYDVKHVISSKHLAGTGSDCSVILSNLKRLVSLKQNIVIRIPIIPDFNDDQESIDAIVTWIDANLSGVSVEIMGYHRYGEGKYKLLDREYQMKNCNKLTPNIMKTIVSTFKSKNINCRILAEN